MQTETNSANKFATEAKNKAANVTIRTDTFGNKIVKVDAETGDEIEAINKLAEDYDAYHNESKNHYVKGVFETAGRSYTRMTYIF